MDYITKNNLSYSLSGAYPMAASAIATAATLATMYGITLPSDMTRITLVPRGDVNIGSSSATTSASALIPDGGVSIPISKAVADNIYLYATAPVIVDLYVFRGLI